MDTIEILYLEDNPMDVKLLETTLLRDTSLPAGRKVKNKYKISHCKNEKEFKLMLNQKEYDLILADYYVPPYDGFKALEYVQQKYSQVPFILISGVAGEEIAVDALQRGAVDYIMKKNLSRISPAIHRALIIASEKKQKVKAEDLRTKYDFIINTSKSFMSLIDRNYTYEAINNAFASAHNLIREEVIGKSLSEIWGESSFREIIKPNLDKTFADNEIYYQAWFDIPKLGKRFFEVTFYPFRNETGEVTHTVVDTFDITERKITEEALQESEEKYRSLVENAQDGICILSDEKIIFANPFVFNKTGYTPDDIIGKPFWKLIHPVEKEKVIENYKKRMAGEKVDSKYDSIITRKDGSTFHVELNAVVIQYEGKDAELAILRDISERKESELILKQSQQEVLAIIENSRDNYWSIDKEYRLLVINRLFKKYFKLAFGITLKIGQSMIEPLPVEIRETWKERYNKALNGENYSFVEKFYIRSRDFYFEINLNPIRDPDRNVIGVSAMARDISDQKTAEVELKASEEKYRNLYNSATIGLYQTTLKDGKVLAANSAVAKIFGYRSVPKFMNEFKASEHYVDPAQRKEFINNAIKNGRVDQMEILGTRCDGTPIPLDISGIYYADKGILEGVIIDITKRKEAEEALRESEEVFRSFSEQTPDGIAMADEEGKIIEWNKGLEHLCGIPKKEVVKKPLWEANALMFKQFGSNDPEQKEWQKKSIQDFYKKGTAPWLGEIQETKIPDKNGEQRWIQFIMFPIKTSKGFILGSITRDISERKKSEETIKQHSLDLSMINDLNSAGNQGENLDSILSHLWNRFELAFNSIGAGIYLLSDDKKQLILQRNQKINTAIERIEKTLRKKLDTIKIPYNKSSLYWRTLENGEPNVINDTKTIAKLIAEHGLSKGLNKFIPQAVKLLGLKSFVNIPLITGKESFGILSIARKEPFNKVDINRLISISTQITSIIRRKSTEERIRQHTEDITLINDLNAAVNKGKSIQEILTILSKQTRRMFAGYGASIYLVSEDQKFLYPVKTSLPKVVIAKIEKLLGNRISSLKVKFDTDSTFTRALKTGEPTLHSSRKEINAMIREFTETKFQKQLVNPVSRILNLKHLLNIPMITEGIPIGILNIAKTEPFSLNDISRLQYIASQVMSIIRRKKAEEDFFESEHKFRALFETANDAIFLMDDNRFVNCNRRTLEMFGCSRTDIIGKTPVMFSPEFQIDGRPSSKSAEEKIREAIKGNNIRFEWIHKKLNGSTFFAEVSLNRLEFKGKNYLQAIVRDISERKKAEEEIIRKEKGLVEAQRISSVGSWEWDIVKKRIKWSDETYSILGLDPEKTNPSLDSFLKIVHSDDRKMVRETIQSALKEKRFTDFMHRIVKPEGDERSVHSRVEVITDPQNNPVRFIGTIHDISDLRRAEVAMMESEEKFRAVFEKGQFAMVVSNLKGKLTSTNLAAQNLFGYSADELAGKTFTELTHKDDLDESKSFFKQVVQGEVPYFVIEKRYIRKNGDIIYCHIGVSSIKNVEGEVINTVGMIIDITEQKIAEQQIKQHTRELLLINTINSMVNKGESLDKIFQHFSNALLQLYACHLTAFVLLSEDKKVLSVENVSMTSNVMNLLEKLVNARVKKHIVAPPANGLLMRCINARDPQPLVTKKQIHTFIREFSTKGASIKMIPEIVKILDMNFVCNFPLYSGKENLGMIVTACTDKYTDQDIESMTNLFEQLTSIIIRKRVEEERIRLSTVIEQMAETVVITDTKGNLQYANPAFESISGYSRDETLNSNMNLLKSGIQKKEFYETLWNTITTGKVWQGKIINRKKDGTLYEERATISPIKDDKGKIINFVAVKQDITRESQLEEQLIQSQKLETVGTLSRGIAHDFNNILGTILGYNEMAMEEAGSNDKIQDYLIRMKKSSNRAKGLVNQILTFGRDLEPETKPVKIRELVKDSLTLFNPTAGKNIKIITQIDKSAQKVPADFSQVQQVILNLLTNANQAMQDKGGILTITAEKALVDKSEAGKIQDLNEGEYIKISISDSGPGMSAEIQAKIFEPFFTTKPVGVGTGLGLSVVHGIVKNHKGAITVHSEEDKGSSFTIYLPL